MSTVHIFVGQCGNQLGCSFLDTIVGAAQASASEEYQMQVSSTHFRPSLSQHRRQDAAAVGGGQAKQQQNLFYSLPPVSGDGEWNHKTSDLPEPRCVMVDMEPKVIEQCINRINYTAVPTHTDGTANTGEDSAGEEVATALRNPPRHSSYCLAPQQCVIRGEGSGNNWALGYYCQGESRRSEIAECLRRESEQSDTGVSTYHVLHSVAGGTGSGVGCVVAEMVKDLYPRASLLHTLVWPFSCGEVATQWYNVALSIAMLNEYVDGAYVAFNDDVSRVVNLELENRGHSGLYNCASYAQLNEQISALVAPLYLPQLLYRVPGPHKDASKNRLSGAGPAEQLLSPQRYARTEDVIEALTLDPAMKFFTGASVPAPTGSRNTAMTTSWASVLSDAARTSDAEFSCQSAFVDLSQLFTAPVEAHPSDPAVSFTSSPRSCLWALRGDAAKTEALRELRHLMALSQERPFPLNSLFISPATSMGTDVGCQRVDHEVTLYGPTKRIGSAMAGAMQRVEELMGVGAYLHHFECYGVSRDDMRDAISKVWESASAYCI